MATNAARVVVAQRAKLSLATVGTALPTTLTDPLVGAFVDVGLFTPDSLTFSTDPSFNEINSHQSDYPVRRVQESDSATFSVTLQEWSVFNFQAIYGGGDVETVSAGVYRFTPPQLGARSEFSAVIEIQDNAKIYRYLIPRCIQVEGVEQALQKGSEAQLPLSLAVLGGDSLDSWSLLTNDPAFAPSV